MKPRIKTTTKLQRMLRAWRERENISQAGAAARLGVPRGTYIQWEQGNRTPRGLSMIALLERIKQ